MSDSDTDTSDSSSTDESIINENKLKELLHQIEANDPSIDKVTIDFHRLNWDQFGKALGKNIHVKQLCIGEVSERHTNRDDVKSFCNELASNNSIEQLTIESSFKGDIIDMLIPFFKQNHNLRRLNIGDHIRNDDTKPNIEPLMRALSTFNTLREFECETNSLSDDDMSRIIHALSFHSQIMKLHLSQNVQSRGIRELALLLNNQNSMLTNVSLWGCALSDSEAIILAEALSNNSSMRTLHLGQNPNIANDGWRAILPQVLSLEELIIWGNTIDNDSSRLVGNAISNGNLRELNLATSVNITTEGWQAVFHALQSSNCMIEHLHLHGNRFSEETMIYLASSLCRNSTVKRLSLEHVTCTQVGWGEFASVFQNFNSVLERVYFGNSSTIGIDNLISYAGSLIRNSTLKVLGLASDTVNNLDDDRVGDAFSELLCNKTTVMETFYSNHTIQTISPLKNGDDDEEDDDIYELGSSGLSENVRSLFQLNRENSKMEAARRKIINVHFTEDCNMQPFVDMDLEVLPHVIAWMARDEYGHTLMYQFLRNFTGVIDVRRGTKSESKSNTQKRKRC